MSFKALHRRRTDVWRDGVRHMVYPATVRRTETGACRAEHKTLSNQCQGTTKPRTTRPGERDRLKQADAEAPDHGGRRRSGRKRWDSDQPVCLSRGSRMRLGGRRTLPPAQPEPAHALGQRCQPLRSDDGVAYWLGRDHRPGLPPLTRYRLSPSQLRRRRRAAQLRRALRRLVRVITHRPDRSGPSDARRQTQLRRQARPGASLEVSRPCSALWSSGESGPTGAARLPMPRRPLKPVLSRAGVLRATGSMPFAASRAVAVTALSRWPARLDESGRLQRRHGSSSRCGPGRVMRRWFSRTGVTLPAPRARQPGRV
jgi:hypothetical protein